MELYQYVFHSRQFLRLVKPGPALYHLPVQKWGHLRTNGGGILLFLHPSQITGRQGGFYLLRYRKDPVLDSLENSQLTPPISTIASTTSTPELLPG